MASMQKTIILGREPASSSQVVHDCELCIVGAGYAALNALNAAAKYLNKGDRVVVIDRNETWGGQWLGQYDFIRLHQPYFHRQLPVMLRVVSKRGGVMRKELLKTRYSDALDAARLPSGRTSLDV